MLKRHEVEILLKAGHAKTEVARLAGVSFCSIKAHRARGSSAACRQRCGTSPATDWAPQHGSEFPESGDGDSAGRTGSGDAGDFAAGLKVGLIFREEQIRPAFEKEPSLPILRLIQLYDCFVIPQTFQ